MKEPAVTSDDVLVVRPLPAGVVLEFCGEIGVVVRDAGSSRLDVMVDGAVQPWYWLFSRRRRSRLVRALRPRPCATGHFDFVPASERKIWRVAPLAGEHRFDVAAADPDVMRYAMRRLRLAARVLEDA